MNSKYCIYCGESIPAECVYCPECGGKQTNNSYNKNYSANARTERKTLRLITFISMVVMMCGLGILILPLVWIIPMTIHYYILYKRNEKPSVGFAVCSIVFAGILPGVLMMVDINYDN